MHTIWLVWMTSVDDREPEWLGGFKSERAAQNYIEEVRNRFWHGRVPHIVRTHVNDAVWEELVHIKEFFITPGHKT